MHNQGKNKGNREQHNKETRDMLSRFDTLEDNNGDFYEEEIGHNENTSERQIRKPNLVSLCKIRVIEGKCPLSTYMKIK